MNREQPKLSDHLEQGIGLQLTDENSTQGLSMGFDYE